MTVPIDIHNNSPKYAGSGAKSQPVSGLLRHLLYYFLIHC